MKMIFRKIQIFLGILALSMDLFLGAYGFFDRSRTNFDPPQKKLHNLTDAIVVIF